jgi:hypothetical protein
MPRNNKTINRVFTEIVPNKAYDQFLRVDQELGIHESEILSDMKAEYVMTLAGIRKTLKTLSKIEEVILQIRSKEMIESELRLSLSRNYIYARSLFYRIGKEINDIRVIVGKTEDYGEDIDSLLSLPGFRDLCKTKLSEAMDKIINENVKQIPTYINANQ